MSLYLEFQLRPKIFLKVRMVQKHTISQHTKRPTRPQLPGFGRRRALGWPERTKQMEPILRAKFKIFFKSENLEKCF